MRFELSTEEADAQRAAGQQAYLKLPEWRFLGLRNPQVQRQVKAWLRQHKELTREQLLEVVEELWSEHQGQPVWERRLAAAELLKLRSKLLIREDVEMLERLLRSCHTWALVDVIAPRPLEDLDRRYDLTPVLDRWIEDEDFWIRRSALLVHLKPLSQGEGDWDRFTRYAEATLHESEFFVRKAIGWVLRSTSYKRPELVAAWMKPRAHRASGVTVREAVKRLDEADRAEILERYKKRRSSMAP